MMTNTMHRNLASFFGALTITAILWLSTLPVDASTGLTVISFA